MYNVSLKTGGHQWQKQNLMTIVTNKGSYDIYKCKCGLQGKTTSLNSIGLKGSYSEDKVYNCPFRAETKIPKKIKIIACTAMGKAFENLTPNSEHTVVEPPKGYKNDDSGVWVMGVGEPVKVLSSEYTEL